MTENAARRSAPLAPELVGVDVALLKGVVRSTDIDAAVVFHDVGNTSNRLDAVNVLVEVFDLLCRHVLGSYVMPSTLISAQLARSRSVYYK
jgi:hypothetical protein